jgi:nucleotide-binding universal stress UspA family protein
MKILLAFSSNRHSRELVDFAIRRAAETGAEIVALLVVDTRLTDLISEEVSDIGFLGEKVSDEFRAAVLREYGRQGSDELERVGQRAHERGLAFTSRVEPGDFLPVTLRVAAEVTADEIIVTRAHRSRMGRFVFGSIVDELARRACCPVTVVSRQPVASESPPS